MSAPTTRPDVAAMLAENARRNAALFEPYDPVKGQPGVVERFRFNVSDHDLLLLPVTMKDDPLMVQLLQFESLQAAVDALANPTTRDKVVHNMVTALNGLRIKHDFEFWCITCATIVDREDKIPIPFKLNRAQRKLLQRFELKRLAGKPIRVVLLKARQWGGSTMTQLYMSWLQLFHYKLWHSCIVADVEDQAKNIRGMYTFMAANHPKDVMKVRLRPFEGSSKIRQVVDRDCIIQLGSMQKPESLRSFNFAMAHFSEVGLWKATVSKKPEDVIQSIRTIIPKRPGTLVVLESTAKGLGNMFHREWLAAAAKKSGYDPVFVAWFEITEYWLRIEGDIGQFISRLSEYQMEQWHQGATLEGINWYVHHQAHEQLDDWAMKSEYPGNPEEAFGSTGRRAFSPAYVRKARMFNRKPDFVGDIHGDSHSGKEAFTGLHLAANDKGLLKIWEMPDTSRRISGRYVVAVDIGGKTDAADYSVIRVLDRAPVLEGGVPEAILTWKGHLDQDLVVWKAAQIAWLYDKALLVPEVNSLKGKEDDTEGEHIVTVLDELVGVYPNIYARTDPEKVKEGAPVKYGWHTNKLTKPNLVDTMNRLLREQGYIEYDSQVCDEYDWYEYKEDGTYGAVSGQHDDQAMTSMIMNKVSDLMPAPRLIEHKPQKKTPGLISNF